MSVASRPDQARRPKALLAGWFSFEHGHATAGDVLAADVARSWLRDAGIPVDLAAVPPFEGDVDWRSVEPADYTHVVFVCGPFNPTPMEVTFLERFAGCRLIGLNLTMATPLEAWNPFDLLFERDSPAGARPDMVFASNQRAVPVIGLCLVEDYEGEQVRVPDANAAIARLLADIEAAVVRIDTRLDVNETGLRSPAEIESLIARTDAVVTTRLHGTVLALKNGVPPLVIDPEAGGAKLRRQAERLGWPVIFDADALEDAALRDALEFCLSQNARSKAAACAAEAAAAVDRLRGEVIAALTSPEAWEPSFDARASAAPGAAGSPPAAGESGAAKPGLIDLAGRAMARALRRLPGAADRVPAAGRVRFGDLRRTEPISREFGYDRGQPVDRHYIEAFLGRHAGDVRGRVLEVGDDTYTRRFGGARVTRHDVLHVEPGNPGATIVADLADAPHIPSATFDCIIVTQTLHLVYGVADAVATLHRILKPGGVVLGTVPGITQTSTDQWAFSWYWGFTALSARRLFATRFPEELIDVRSCGNVLAATAFLQGLAAEELSTKELAVRDPAYPMLITVRAVKPADASSPDPHAGNADPRP